MAIATARERRVIRPQPGPQSLFLRSKADLAVYGGAAGGGKTFALLLEPLRHVANPKFSGVIFRRTFPQVRNEGGLWDQSAELYPYLGAVPQESRLEWQFPSGATIRFAHLQHEETKHDWQGAELPFIAFDELTHFSQGQVFYMLSRNRSLSGVRPYMRAATNPDALSWVKPFLSPWLDREREDLAESGELRWFVRDGGEILWVPEETPDAKSVTFVRASVYDNPILLTKDPGYLANLKALARVDRARLLEGDWEIVAGGNMFRREWFEIVREAPAVMRRVRFWDLAASKPKKEGRDPDWTCGALMGTTPNGLFYLEDMRRVRTTPLGVEALVRQTAEADRARYGEIDIWMEEEPGSSGVTVIDSYSRIVLKGFTFRGVRSTGPKEERAKPLSAAAEAGNVKLVAGVWNHDFLNEAEAFPPLSDNDVHDDQVDSASGAHAKLAGKREIKFY